MRAFLAVSALLLTASVASAAPRSAKARADFARGVKAYKATDYAAASDAFEKSFGEEEDVETLFAWAQSERLQDRCASAVRLYKKLEKFELPAANRAAVIEKLKECQAILAANKPAPAPEPEPEPVKPPPKVKPEPEPEPEPEAPSADPEPVHPRKHASDGPSVWWKDPIGDSLFGLGLVGLGAGGGFYLAANAKESSRNSDNFKAVDAAAHSDGVKGTAFLIGGGVLAVAGLIRYATLGGSGAGDKHASAGNVVSGWAAPTGGGLVISGEF